MKELYAIFLSKLLCISENARHYHNDDGKQLQQFNIAEKFQKQSSNFEQMEEACTYNYVLNGIDRRDRREIMPRYILSGSWH